MGESDSDENGSDDVLDLVDGVNKLKHSDYDKKIKTNTAEGVILYIFVWV